MSHPNGNGLFSHAGIARSPRRIRLLIADDHTSVLSGLIAIIGMQPDMEVVAQAENGGAAVEMWRRHRPDVVLLDFRMPQLDAAGVLSEIRQIDPNIRSIVLTTFDCASDAIRAVTAGAKAYLTKDVGREELLYCIRRVNAGGTCIPKGFIEKMNERIARERSSEGNR